MFEFSGDGIESGGASIAVPSHVGLFVLVGGPRYGNDIFAKRPFCICIKWRCDWSVPKSARLADFAINEWIRMGAGRWARGLACIAPVGTTASLTRCNTKATGLGLLATRS